VLSENGGSHTMPSKFIAAMAMARKLLSHFSALNSEAD
jgi:hypothetical protein